MSTRTLKSKTKAVSALTDSADGINHIWPVNNESPQKVVILDLFNDGKSTKETVYEQGITKLTTKYGKEIIDGASTTDPMVLAQISLNDTHNNMPATLYEIVFANPSNLYPVKSTAVGLTYPANLDDDAYFAAQTIDATAVADINAAANFIRTITANPSSTLATGFTQAVQDATTNCKTSAAIDTAISTWFQNNTVTFKTVTLNAIAALQSYFAVFPYEYMDYNASKTYYLYSSDGTTVTYQGTFALQNTNSTSDPASIDKTLPGFSFIHTTADGKTQTTLTYYKGQFVDKGNEDAPNICLSGTFMVKSLLSNKDTDTALISVMTGVVFGHKVIGSDIQQQIPDPTNPPDPSNPNDQWSGLYGLLHPTNAMGLITLAMTMAGLSAFFKDLVFAPLKALWNKLFKKKVEKKGEEPTDEESAEIHNDVDALVAEWQPEIQLNIDRMGSSVNTNENLIDLQKDFGESLTGELNEMERSTMIDELNSDNDALTSAAEYQNTEAMQEASYNNFIEERYIKRIPSDDLSNQLPVEEPKVTQYTIDTTNAVNEAVEGAAAEIVNAVEESKQAAQDAAEQRESLEEQRQKAEEGDADEGTSESDPFEGGGED